jgi:4-amino-4-deoxy-L-arabinose transferase-like glycosyltransferase
MRRLPMPSHAPILRSIAAHRLTALLVFGLILRLPVILLVAENPTRAVPMGDPPGYHQLALNLYQRGIYSMSPGAPFVIDASRTPGYPLFLAGVFHLAGPSDLAVVLVQSLIHALTGVLLAVLGERLFRSRRIGVTGAVLWAIAPLPAVFAGIFLTEILFTLFFLLLLLAVTGGGYRRAAAAGALLGIAILIRPIGIFLWPSLLPALCLGAGWRKAAVRCALFSITMGLALAPWLIRNQVLFSRPTLAAVQGVNLLYNNAAGYVAWRDGLHLKEAREVVDGYYRAYLAENGLHPANGTEESDAMSAAGMQVLLADPVRAVWFNALDALNGFRPGASYLVVFLEPGTIYPNSLSEGELSPAVSNISRPEVLGITVAVTIFYGIVFLLTGVGILHLLRDRNWLPLALLILPCFLLLYLPGISSNARFRLPLEPGFFLLAGVAIHQTIPCLYRRLRRKASPAA